MCQPYCSRCSCSRSGARQYNTARPSGPSSHLWPSATTKSAWTACTSSGSAPRLWMASMQTSNPRSRQAAPYAVNQTRLAHLLALRPQRLPFDTIRRELLVADDDVVARGPRQAICDQRESFRGVFQQRDVIAVGRVEQYAQLLAQRRLDLGPARIIPRALGRVLGGEALYRLRRAAWPGRDGGVIEVDEVVVEDEFIGGERRGRCGHGEK